MRRRIFVAAMLMASMATLASTATPPVPGIDSALAASRSTNALPASAAAPIAGGLARGRKGPVTPAHRAGKAAPRRAKPGTNLLVNPGAEVGECTTSGYDGMTVPGWTTVVGSPDSVCYGAIGFPRVAVPRPGPLGPAPSSSNSSGPAAGNRAEATGPQPTGPQPTGPQATGPQRNGPQGAARTGSRSAATSPDTGRAFFSGGATGNATLSQRIDLGSAEDAINRDDATYDFSGWLGGFAGQDDRVSVTAEFADKSGSVLYRDVLPVVTNTDRKMGTKLIRRHVFGLVPFQTRTVTITMSFIWTAGDTTDGYVDDLSFALSTPVVAPRLTVPNADVVPKFDHVFVVFMENENYGPNEAPANRGNFIVTNPRARYLNGVLAYNGALLSQMYATTHPSDPNYLAVTGGSTFGWTRNPVVGADRIHATNLADAIEAHGLTWKAYADGMAYNCDTTAHNTAAGGLYLPDDEPFMLYADVVENERRCEAHNQPLSQLGVDLGRKSTTPSFVWFAANDVNSMERGDVGSGDDWLRQFLPEIFGSPAWTTQRSLLIISWDEGHTKSFGPGYPNHVPTYVLASQGLVKDDYTSKLRYTAYSLTATIEAALGLKPMTSNDKYADPLSDIWTSSGSGGGMPPGAEASYRTSGSSERSPVLRRAEPAA